MSHKTFPKPEPKPAKRRRPLRAISEKRTAYQEELDAAKPLVVARAMGLCELCRVEPGTVVHHKMRRSQGGTNELDNLALLSDEHHRFIHDHPSWAYAEGWLMRRKR